MKKRKILIVGGILILLLVALGIGGWSYHEQPQFCGNMCHIMDPYLQSWQASDFGASAHAAQGVACLDCHEPTIQEQVTELTTYIKGDYTIPLAELKVSDEFCYDCHLLDEHENLEQVVQRTADRDENPHASHLIGDVPCATCHKMHKPSQDLCAQCHDPIAIGAGWTSEEVPPITEVGLQLFEPDMDCTACKVMGKYQKSLEDPEASMSVHAQEGLTCLDCHEQDKLEQVHEAAVPTNRIKARRFGNELCFGCHLENKHKNYEQLAERTADFVAPSGEQVNPHAMTVDESDVKAPHESGKGQVQCYECHTLHKGEPTLDYCYGCHHTMTFQVCSRCHLEDGSVLEAPVE